MNNKDVSFNIVKRDNGLQETQDMVRMLTMLVGQQQGFKDQLTEMTLLMRSSSENLLAEIRGSSGPAGRQGLGWCGPLPKVEPESPNKVPDQEWVPSVPETGAAQLMSTGPERPNSQNRMTPSSPEPSQPKVSQAQEIMIKQEVIQPQEIVIHDEAPKEAPPSQTAASPLEGLGSAIGHLVEHLVEDTQETAEKLVVDAKKTVSVRSSSLMSIVGGREKEEESDEGGENGHPTVFHHFRHTCRRAVASDRFEMSAASLIVANSLVLAFNVQYAGLDICYQLKFHGCLAQAVDIWPLADATFSFLDWFFGIAFLMEAVFKIVAMGHKYFCDKSTAGWNWLDFICVLAFFVDKGASAFLPLDAQALRLLRLLRLMRLVRLLRTLESLDVLYIMTTAIRGMSKVVAYAVLLLSMMLATCSLFLTQVLHASYFSDAGLPGMSEEDVERRQKLYEYFGTFTRCFVSMFELTLANWPPVTRLLAEEVSEWFMFFCLVHKLTIGFAVIGVINGVIMQETFKVAANDDVIMVRQKKRAAQIGAFKMKNLFDKLDSTGDGNICYEEFEVIAQNPDVKTWLASMDIETDDMRTLFALIDFDGSGSISVEELVSRIPRIKGAARSIDVLAMRTRLNETNRLLTAMENGFKIPKSALDNVVLGGSYSAVPKIGV